MRSTASPARPEQRLGVGAEDPQLLRHDVGQPRRADLEAAETQLRENVEVRIVDRAVALEAAQGDADGAMAARAQAMCSIVSSMIGASSSMACGLWARSASRMCSQIGAFR